jgi:hypothetical protein
MKDTSRKPVKTGHKWKTLIKKTCENWAGMNNTYQTCEYLAEMKDTYQEKL